MTRTRLVAAALLSLPLLMTGAAQAGTDVPAAPFKAIDVHGGGSVVLRHGAVQRVTVTKGDLKNSSVEVHGGTLDIQGCRSFWNCSWGYSLEIEVVAPDITSMEVHGGGDLVARGDFPAQDTMKLSVHGGGDVDIRAIPVKNVTASVHGGGDLKTHAIDSLTADVHGGGSVSYTGNPKVSSTVHGGGSISRE